MEEFIMSKSIYTEVVTLPSNGLLNPEIPNGEVTLRCVTVADQKFVSGTNLPGDLLVQELLRRCVESPEGFDPAKLTSIDTFFLITKLRILSYGGKYSFIVKCPECGKKTEVELDLADLTVDYLDPDYESKMKVKLPRTGDTVFTRLLTNNDDREIDKEAKRLSKKFKDSGDNEFILRLVKSISRIELKGSGENGNKIIEDPISIQKYVENLTDLDATAIMSTLSPTYGIQTSIETRCSECKEDIEVSLRFTPQFFRPKYDASH